MHIIGHRGARGEYPENTLIGFEAACNAGVDGIELDLRLSADEQPMVIHDANAQRTTGVNADIETATAQELAALNAASRYENCPFQSIPTIYQVLAQIPALRDIQLEIKPVSSAQLDAITRRIDRLFHDDDLFARAWVTSFDRRVLRAIADLEPRIRLGYLYEEPEHDPVSAAQALTAQLLAPHYSLVDQGLVADAHRAGLTVSVWTVNDMAEANRLESLGVDSIITDYPTMICQRFKEG